VRGGFLYALVVACAPLLTGQPQRTTTTYTITTVAGNGSPDFPLGDGGFAQSATRLQCGSEE
jgi:hypothetical protein